MVKNLQKGFTLIELLVVVAIIGVLSAVVLNQLSGARDRSADFTVKTNLASIIGQAEIWRGENSGKYRRDANPTTVSNVATCSLPNTIFVDPSITKIFTDIIASTASIITCAISGSGFEWAISATLKDNKVWCIDNTVQGKVVTSGILTNPTVKCS